MLQQQQIIFFYGTGNMFWDVCKTSKHKKVKKWEQLKFFIYEKTVYLMCQYKKFRK